MRVLQCLKQVRAPTCSKKLGATADSVADGIDGILGPTKFDQVIDGNDLQTERRCFIRPI